jgi:regulator of RNase E activity RraB
MGVTEVVVDEEISGDGWWHITAFTTLRLTPEEIRESMQNMMLLAAATGIRYDGWQVTFNAAEERQLARQRPDLKSVHQYGR